VKNTMPESTRRRAGKVYSYPTHLEHAPEERRFRIERAAYFKAEERGFAPGQEMQDWLEAERELDQAS
jgi:hypothetical protein